MPKLIAHRLDSKANATFYWERWIDVETWREWDREVVSASLNGSFSLAAKGTVQLRDGRTSKFEVIDINHGKEYELAFPLFLAEMRLRRTVAARNDGCWFEHEVRFEGPMSWLFGMMLGKKYQESLPVAMERLRTLVENPPQATF